MEELAIRFRRAEPDDAGGLRTAPKITLSHPDVRGRPETFLGAIDRGRLLLLERYDRRSKDWAIGGFVDYHMRVDDRLTIRDVGIIGDSVHAASRAIFLTSYFARPRPTRPE